MDFFRYLSFTGDGIKSPSGQASHAGSELTDLLSIIITLDVNLLPFTWSLGLEELGSGATGQVNQSELNANTSLAFKRFTDYSDALDCPSPAHISAAYAAFTKEIVILSHPVVYQHPNLVNLEGVCWEIVEDEIRPVLVFRKALEGNLRKFLASQPEGELDLESRFQICGEIARGLGTLHRCGESYC